MEIKSFYQFLQIQVTLAPQGGGSDEEWEEH